MQIGAVSWDCIITSIPRYIRNPAYPTVFTSVMAWLFLPEKRRSGQYRYQTENLLHVPQCAYIMPARQPNNLLALSAPSIMPFPSSFSSIAITGKQKC